MAIQFIGNWQIQWPFKKKSRIRHFDFSGEDWFSFTGSSSVQWNKFIEDEKQNYDELIRAYNTISEVAAPIEYWGENSGKVKFKIFEETAQGEEEVTNVNDPLYKLLNEPNEYLGWNEFKGNCLLNFKLLGNTYINFIGSDVFTNTPTSMYVLPAQNTRVSIKGMKNNVYKGDFRDSTILEYVFIIDTNPKTVKAIPKEQVLHMRSINPNYNNGSFLYGLGSIVPAQYAVNSIYSGYSAKVGLYQNGAKTIMSPNFPTNTEYGSYSLPDSEQIAEEQKRIQKYGLEEGQWQTIISRIPLNANRLSFNIGELRINENNIRDFQTICGKIGIDSRIFNDPTSSTFANQEQSEKKFYQGAFMAWENNFFNDLTQKLKTYEAWKNRIVKPDYSDIPQLAESERDTQEILLPDVEKGLITRAEYIEARGESIKDLPAEFFEYYTLINGVWTPLNQKQDENT